MKIILSLIFLCFINTKVTGQNSDTTGTFNTGEMILSIGYGYPSIDKYLYGKHPSLGVGMYFTKNGYGPFHFRGEYSISDKIGIGISINYDTYGGTLKGNGKIDDPYTYKNTISSLTSLIRFNYHFAITKKLDSYFSVGIGFRRTKNIFTTDDPNDSGTIFFYNSFTGTGATPFPIAFEAIVGMRYYFSKNIGIYSEIGIAKSIIHIGICQKFKILRG